MAYDKTKTNPTRGKVPAGTPNDSEWGFNNDGESKNTFGPRVESTPNEVGGEEKLARKHGKGRITGGIEEEDIFGEIDYTGNTAEAGTIVGNAQTLKPETWRGYAPDESQEESMKNSMNTVGGYEYGKSHKGVKVNGKIVEDEGTEIADEVAKPMNKKRHIKPEAKFNGRNPNDQNVKLSKNILS